METEVVRCNYRTITRYCFLDNDKILYGKLGKSKNQKNMRFYKSHFDINKGFKFESKITKKEFENSEKTLKKIDILKYKKCLKENYGKLKN